MNYKKILILLSLSIISCLCLLGCNNDNNASKKLFGDRSEYVQKVPLSEVEYGAAITTKIAPITQDGYALQTQAISIKNGRTDRSSELSKIDIMLGNIQTTREFVNELEEPSTKTDTKKSLISSLDNYSAELTDYKNLLSQENIKATDLQNKIDIVMGKLNLVKQYAK